MTQPTDPTVEVDRRSPLEKALRMVAVDAVAKLRRASDEGRVVDRQLIGDVQDDVADAVRRVYYGFHGRLEAFERKDA